jgi:hypothetical protein
MRSLLRILSSATALATGVALSAASAQAPTVQAASSAIRSHSSGFYVGLGYEGDGAEVIQAGAPVESGSGGGLVLGYGFTPKFSIYTESSGATMVAADGSAYTLAHLDIGMRRHFRTGSNVVVPFIQTGLSFRAAQQSLDIGTATGSGVGASFGVGMNAHFNPALAFSAAATWTYGYFGSYQVDGSATGGEGVDALTTRLHLGFIWFPGA